MRLINATPSPYGRKVAVAMKEKGLKYEFEYDNPWHEGTYVHGYSPFQQLPILISDENHYIYDSNYILEWVERRFPNPALLPADVDELLEARLLQLLGERLMEISALIIFQVQRADASKALGRQTRKIATGLAELSKVLGSRKLAIDEPIRLGDIAVVTTLTMFEFMIENDVLPNMPEFAWRERYRNIVEFVEAIEARPPFQETRPVMMDVNLQSVVA